MGRWTQWARRHPARGCDTAHEFEAGQEAPATETSTLEASATLRPNSKTKRVPHDQGSSIALTGRMHPGIYQVRIGGIRQYFVHCAPGESLGGPLGVAGRQKSPLSPHERREPDLAGSTLRPSRSVRSRRLCGVELAIPPFPRKLRCGA